MKKKILIILGIIVGIIMIFLVISFIKYCQHTNVARINSKNWGIVGFNTDYWKGKYYNIYSDGEVEFYDLYNLSGKKNEKIFKLSFFETITVRLLSKIGTLIPDDYSSAVDGTGWNFYDIDANGEMVEKYSGYIYSNNMLETVIQILEGKAKEIKE